MHLLVSAPIVLARELEMNPPDRPTASEENGGTTFPQSESATATCCSVGGGPAGVMLGFLLARKGVDVLVLEKHKDFFRDFRGDTIHPSTLELMSELGLL